jgi:hypothetical protein
MIIFTAILDNEHDEVRGAFTVHKNLENLHINSLLSRNGARSSYVQVQKNLLVEINKLNFYFLSIFFFFFEIESAWLYTPAPPKSVHDAEC